MSTAIYLHSGNSSSTEKEAVTGQYEVTAITETEYKNNLELETHAEPDNNEALAADDLILQYQYYNTTILILQYQYYNTTISMHQINCG